MTRIGTYLERRSVHGQWPIAGEWPPAGQCDPEAVRQVVVIPVLAEFEGLFLTLNDLAANDPDHLAKTLVICVVNNRTPAIAGLHDVEDNRQTLLALPDFTHANPGMRLAWIDAASPGVELGPKEGVGLARKIGLDHGLAVLHRSKQPEGALISLDADTRVPPDYLRAVRSFFQREGRWAAVVDYAHPVEGPAEKCLPILSYELFLRYQELGWHYAGSPYAYPAIGSTMVCTGKAYATSGGMNRRQAGEDFYFLQQLAKTGRVERIRETTVMPSSRVSHRVPFGTGRKVGLFEHDPDDAWLAYHPETFHILKRWLDTARGNLDDPGGALRSRAADIHPELASWLDRNRFADGWDRVRRHCATETQRARQFHLWFDAFRTLKLLHHLRDHGFPRQDLFAALKEAMQWNGLEPPVASVPGLRHDCDGQRALLYALRRWRPGNG